MEFPVKGGYPRIVVKIQKLDAKKEQGFSGHKVYSLKSMMSTNTKAPLMLGPKKSVNVISHINGALIGGEKTEKRINGIPLSVFVK
jgi:hypothetical protein